MEFILDLKKSVLVLAWGLEIPYDYIVHTFIHEDFLEPYWAWEPSTIPEPHLGDNGHYYIPDEHGVVNDLIGEDNIEDLVECYLEEQAYLEAKQA